MFTNMKVALLLSGQFREGADCFPYLKGRILDKYSPDVFISCWNPSEIINYSLQADTIHLGDTLTIGDVISLYKPKSILSEDFDSDKIMRIAERASHYDLYTPMNGEMNPVSVFCMWYKIGSSLRLMKEYESATGVKYDYIIKARFDVKIHSDIIPTSDSYSVVIPRGFDWRGGINDVFAHGQRNAMEHYCSLYDSIENYISGSSVFFHPETLLRHHLYSSEFNVERSDLKISLRGKNLWETEVNDNNEMKKNSRYIVSKGNFWDT